MKTGKGAAWMRATRNADARCWIRHERPSRLYCEMKTVLGRGDAFAQLQFVDRPEECPCRSRLAEAKGAHVVGRQHDLDPGIIAVEHDSGGKLRQHRVVKQQVRAAGVRAVNLQSTGI